MEKDSEIEINRGYSMDFWIVTFVNNKENGFSRIGAMYPIHQDCLKHLDAMRCVMKSDDQDSLHLFPDEWTIVYDHYVSGSLRPEDTRFVPVKSLIMEK